MPAIDHTHHAAARSWVPSAQDHGDFPIQNLPIGIFSRRGETRRGGIAIGDEILDLAALLAQGVLDDEASNCARAASGPDLNSFMALPPSSRRALRHAVFALLKDDCADRDRVSECLYPAAECTMHLPARIGDYTDFFVGIHHARAVGSLFRPDNPLLPNYRHVPIGYHGRASSIRPSGIDVRRPLGQTAPTGDEGPAFGPSRRLDFELEMGVWIGPGNALGEPIAIADAAKHVAGFCLLNDWSARDVQAWEYQPLGPFLAKSFASTISPWVIMPEALAPFRCERMARGPDEPEPMPYLSDAEDRTGGGLDLDLAVWIRTARMKADGADPVRLSASGSRYMYWTVAQMVTHHASNGCNLNPGDLLGTGTLSGPDRDQAGSLLELSAGGSEPVTLPNGETRSFLADGDEITLSARAHRDGYASIGFGECRASILPAPAGAD